MKIRTNTNVRIRTAGAVMLAALTFATAACGGSETIESADAAEVTAEAPASEEPATEAPAEQVATTAAPTAPQPGTEQPAPATESQPTGDSGGTVSQSEAPAEQPATEQSVPPTTTATEEAPPTTEAEQAPPTTEAEQAPPTTEAEQAPPTTEAAAPDPVQELIASLSFAQNSTTSIIVDATLTNVQGSRTKGIASVCAVQYNEYGNPNPGPTGFVLVDGVRYPALLIEGCSPNANNFGEYTKTWSVAVGRGINGSLKSYYDIAIRAEDGQVKVYCGDVNNFRAGWVERTLSANAGRVSLGACPL